MTNGRENWSLFDYTAALRAFFEKRLVFVILLWGVVLCFVFLHFTVDDAFISFRYAQNLVTSGRWDWNPSGVRVEAYTSFIYAALAVIPHAFNFSAALFFKILGCLFFSVIVYRVISSDVNRTIKTAVIAFLVLNPAFFVHAFSGLETPLFMMLLLESLIRLRRVINSSEAQTHKLGVDYCALYISSILLPLTRPEGIVVTLFIFVMIFWKNKGRVPYSWLFTLVAAVGIGYFLWRYAFFGTIFPNTFYAKQSHSSVYQALISNLNRSKVYVLGTLILVLFGEKKSIGMMIPILVVFMTYLPMNLVMNYSDRFFFQLFIPAQVFLVISSRREFLSGRFFSTSDLPAVNGLLKKTAGFVLILAAVIFCFMGEVGRGYKTAGYVKTYSINLSNVLIDFGKRLSAFKGRDYSLMIGDVGVVPYYSRWLVYDSMGLANQIIAKEGITDAFMRSSSPSLVCIYASKQDGPLSNEDVAIDREKGLAMLRYVKESGEYAYIASFKAQHYYVASYMKTGLKDFDELRTTIVEHAAQSRNVKASLNDILLFRYLSLISLPNAY